MNTKIKTAIKNGTFISRTITYLKNKRRIRYIHKSTILEIQNQDEAYRKLKRFALTKKGELDRIYDDVCSNKIFSKIIWWCWLQGLENAPIIPLKCYERLKTMAVGYDIRVIDETNIENYVTVYEHIKKKYKAKVISPAHYSDIIRVLLLEKWGGVWIDSTVYCSGSDMFSVLEDSNIFMFKAFMNDFGGSKCSSWLISSVIENRYVKMLKLLLVTYWKDNNILLHYYTFHMFVGIIAAFYPDLWREIPTYSNTVPHIMAEELAEKYDPKRYEQLVLMSDFHKLSYRMEYSSVKDCLYEKLFIN